jgi:hypothetical protein
MGAPVITGPANRSVNADVLAAGFRPPMVRRLPSRSTSPFGAAAVRV